MASPSERGSVTIEFALLVPVIVAGVSLAATALAVGSTDARARLLTETVAQQVAAGFDSSGDLVRLRRLGSVSFARDENQVCVSWSGRHVWLTGTFTSTSRGSTVMNSASTG